MKERAERRSSLAKRKVFLRKFCGHTKLLPGFPGAEAEAR